MALIGLVMAGLPAGTAWEIHLRCGANEWMAPCTKEFVAPNETFLRCNSIWWAASLLRKPAVSTLSHPAEADACLISDGTPARQSKNKVQAAISCEKALFPYLPWHFLNFLPLPQGHRSLRPGWSPLTTASTRGPRLFQICRRS